jgi:signal transduction histidine kinase
MRLSAFIIENLEPILQAWEDFARSLPTGNPMTVAALRDDAERMLRFIAYDMETPQSSRERFLKSVGAGPKPGEDAPSAAQDHGVARAVDRFTLFELTSEYRALRASVLALWLNQPERGNDVEQIIRFNEAVDQLIAESVERYSGKLAVDGDLFTASIGHDLRNPLNAIAMSAEYLAQFTDRSDHEKSAISQIAQSAQRIASMIDELQDFSRVRLTNTLSFTRESLDVARVCQEVADEIRASTPRRRVAFAQAGNTVTIANAERIRQLLSNLIGNAVQHGGDDCDVNVRVDGQDEALAISVHNTGPAIPPESLPRIFEPLYRVERTPADRTHLGLGLYIVRQIAVAHGGDVSVTSDSGGTTFRVRLPRVVGAEPQS